MGKPKLLVILLALVLQVSLLPVAGRAEAAPDKGGMISQEEAIRIFCTAFPDITRGKELTAEYQEQGYSETPAWEITSKKKGIFVHGPEEISGVVDAYSGQILGLNYYPNAEFYLNKNISLTRDEAREIAWKFLTQNQPDKVKTLHMNENDSINPFNRNMQLYYSFTWNRQMNGLPVDWDSITVGVDAYTGMVTHYHCQWHQVELPELAQLLPRNELQKKLENDIGLVLSYVYERDGNGRSTGKIIPVYRLNVNANIIDARTGEFLDSQGKVLSIKNVKTYDKDYTTPNSMAAINETPWPTQPVDPEFAKQSASDFFKTMGYNGEIRRSGGGSSSSDGFREEHWSYRPVEAETQFDLDVDINASTGQVVGFNRSSSGQGSLNLSYEQCLDKAREAIQKIHPDKISQVAINHNMYQDKNSNYFYYQFIRLLNGIPFERDRITVMVDKNSGQVTYYRLDWRPVKCEAVSGLVTLEEAKAQIWSRDGLVLSYIFPRDDQYKITGESIPVYRLPSVEINARTGKPMYSIDDQQTTLPKETWSGHWAAPALSLLHANGLIKDKTTPPEEIMQRVDILRVLVAATHPNVYYGDEENIELQLTDVPANDPDQTIYKMAVNRGIIQNQGKFEPHQSMKREELAVWLVRSIGYQPVAEMKNRIDIPVVDSREISPDKINYAAIVHGLNLMSADQQGRFEPNKQITWAQMASIAGRIAPRAMEVNERSWNR
ncbi:MAG: PepSY domain-containing protein [Syntrophomonadaceae bacterium]|jgi:hypothetical protein